MTFKGKHLGPFVCGALGTAQCTMCLLNMNKEGVPFPHSRGKPGTVAHICKTVTPPTVAAAVSQGLTRSRFIGSGDPLGSLSPKEEEKC